MNISRRITKNILMLYFRMILTTGVSLYTVRIVLDVLGIEDYGLYNVVGGAVALLSFLPNSLASATQRFFSFALGQNDKEKLKKTFTANLIVYAAIAVLALLALESVGIWLVSEYLRVPEDRYDAVIRLYHLSVLTFATGIVTSPFMAIIIAHEDMHLYAFMAFGEAFLKLGSVLLLVHVPWDKLELYGLLVLVVTIVNALIYIGICIHKYEECQFQTLYWDKALIRDIIAFTGWTLFGQITTVARNQAITILLNQMFNPVVVAARAVAINLANKVNAFSSKFNVGLYPPIVKAYASGDRREMHGLIFSGSKVTFYLLWVLALPLLLVMEELLAVWLKDPPPGSVLFARLALLEALITAVSLPLMTAARAPGKMAFYESVMGSIQATIFPISWLVLKLGGAPYSVFVIAIVGNVVMLYVRLVIVRSLIDIVMREFVIKVCVPALTVILLSAVPSAVVTYYLRGKTMGGGMAVIISMLLTLLCIYFFGVEKEWRHKLVKAAKVRLQEIL